MYQPNQNDYTTFSYPLAHSTQTLYIPLSNSNRKGDTLSELDCLVTKEQPEDDGLVIHVYNQSPEEVAQFWSSERMNNAKPIPMPTIPLPIPPDLAVKPLSAKTIKHLIKLAEQSAWGDRDNEDYDYYSHYGGNIDDAFDGGVRDGETMLARDILIELGINFEVEE